jgi:hypothetical protein
MTVAEVASARRNQVPLGIAYMVGSTAMFAGGGRALPIDLRAAVTWTGRNPSHGTAADDRMPSRPAHNRAAERTGF